MSAPRPPKRAAKPTTFYAEGGRTVPAWRAWQLSAITATFLSLVGYWTLTSTAGEARRVAAQPTGAPPSFTLLLAGRDIAYCYYHQPCKDQNSDAARRLTRTDTIMLVRVRGGDIDVLSIPRDTQASDQTWQKINAAYSVGGPELLKTQVEGITGVEIDSYAVVRTTYAAQIIDALGGLSVKVPEPGIEWIDNAAGVNFKLAPGEHQLGGADAVLYMRVRKGFGDDYGRMDHQKAALAQLLDKARSPRALAAVLPLALNFRAGVETDADPLLLEQMRPFLSGARIDFATLPVREIRGSTNLLPDREALARLWGSESVTGTVATVAAPGIDSAVADPARPIRVFDASGVTIGDVTLGQKVAWALTARGFSVAGVVPEPVGGENSQVFTLDAVASAGRVARFLDLPRLQGLRYPVEAGEVGVFLGRDAAARYAELLGLDVTPQPGEAQQAAAPSQTSPDSTVPGQTPDRSTPDPMEN